MAGLEWKIKNKKHTYTVELRGSTLTLIIFILHILPCLTPLNAYTLTCTPFCPLTATHKHMTPPTSFAILTQDIVLCGCICVECTQLQFSSLQRKKSTAVLCDYWGTVGLYLCACICQCVQVCLCVSSVWLVCGEETFHEQMTTHKMHFTEKTQQFCGNLIVGKLVS